MLPTPQEKIFYNSLLTRDYCGNNYWFETVNLAANPKKSGCSIWLNK